jgi:hypothetical protein
LTAPFYFEAAWRPDVVKPGVTAGGAICLSKLRWQSLPPGGNCPSVLPDPRLDGNPSGVFCEDLGGFDPATPPRELLVNLETHSALVFSSSQVNDKALWAWNNSAREYLVTTTGEWNGNVSVDVPPPNSINFKIDDPTHQYIANVLAAPEYDANGTLITRELVVYTLGGRYRTSTTRPTGWAHFGDAGYVYATAADVPSRSMRCRCSPSSAGPHGPIARRNTC